MWQSGLAFTAGFLLSAGSAIAVAETDIQAGQAPQSLALSVAEFAKLMGDDAGVSTPDAAVPAPVQATQPPPDQQADAPPSQTGERRVRSFSLVGFVEQATAEGHAEEVPRISLVDLVADAADAEADAAPAPVSPEPVVMAPPASNDDASKTSVQLVVPPVTVVRQTEDIEPPPATGVSEKAQVVADQGERAGSVRSAPDDAPSLHGSLVIEPFDLPAVDTRSSKLQLFDAVRSALNEHPAIVESLSRLDEQQQQISVARAGYWPQVRSGLNTGYRHTTGRSEEAFTVSASQMIYDFGKVSSAVEAATSGVDREEASVLLAAEDLIRDTVKAFIEARRYEELLQLATEQIDAIAELEALAAKRSALGAATASDQMQARSRREAARATQLQMQAQRDQWHRALENLVGSRQAVTLDAAYPEPLERLCPRLPENFESAPRVVMAEAERAEAEAAIRQARAEMRPTLSLNADFEHYLNRANEGLQRLDDQEFVVSLNLTSNLFQGGALRARSRAADHALYSASAARDRALLELSRLYRETRDRARSLTSSLALQDERHASIVQTQELYRHQYLSLGTRTLLDILNTEQEIFQTRVDKQNTLFDLRSLQIDCLYSVGGLRDAFRAGEALNQRVSSRRAEERS